MKRILLVAFILVILCVTATSCDKSCSHVYDNNGICEKCGQENAPTYTVTFDTDGGTKIKAQNVKNGDKVKKPKTPEKEGYEFDGWYCGDEKWSFVGYVVTDDMTLTAKWIPITYCVMFVDENDSIITTQTVAHGEKLSWVSLPQKDGCSLAGWSKGGIIWDFNNATVTGNMTLKARWVADVFYYLDGGTNSEQNPAYVYSDGNYPISLSDPIKSGYSFQGWYTDDSFTTRVDYISACAPHTLYALWLKDNGGSNFESNYPWGPTEIIYSINEDSDTDQLPSSSRRYLAGRLSETEVSDYSRVDDYVADRNTEATAYTGVTVSYQYLPDGSSYGWGMNIQRIYRQATSGDPMAPDVYIDFVYDMVAASLKGAFANLYSTTMYGPNHEWSSTEYNYFAFEDSPVYQDTGKNYMYEYMRSLTLSKFKMYCLSSDYFVDMVRAFLVVPVNIEMLEQIGVAKDAFTGELIEGKANSDRTGDGKFNIDDFYELVWDGEWNYEALAVLSNAITLQIGAEEGIGLDDRIGFALATGNGIPASGMLYSTSITIVKREYDGSDYRYSYSNIKQVADGSFVFDNESEDIAFEQLDTFCKNLATLVDHDGVITVSSGEANAAGYYNDLQAIRMKFVNNTLLFGGVTVLGGLEHQDYLDMKGEGKKGYGIAPIPLYHSEGGDEYRTQIHNNGKIGAISVGTRKFAQCTAYLDYQSTNSNKILNEYYNHKLRQTVQVKGTDENAEMLKYIREHVRSSFDKTFEDALGAHYSAQSAGDYDKNKWHNMIKDANFELKDMRTQYAGKATTKAAWLYDLETKVYDTLPS